jgi:hypothetical protein
MGKTLTHRILKGIIALAHAGALAHFFRARTARKHVRAP